MPANQFGANEPLQNAIAQDRRAEARAAARAEDSARVRAAMAAGPDSRSIGITRSRVAERGDTDEM